MSVKRKSHNLDEALRLADRVLVLSRRPGRMKEIISIDIPQRERDKAAALPTPPTDSPAGTPPR